MDVSKNSKDASGTLFSCAKHGDKNKKNSLNQNVAILKKCMDGRWWLRSKTRSWNTREQDMETKRSFELSTSAKG